MFKRFFFNQRSTYSRWDGSQHIEGLDADDILNALADDYLRDNNLRSALQRLQEQGFQGRNGQQAMGMRELMQRLRQQQSSRQQRYNMSGVMDDIRQKLESIKAHEREGIQRRLDETNPNRQPPSTVQPTEAGGEPSPAAEAGPPSGSPSPQGQSGQSSGQGQQDGLPEGVDSGMLRKMIEQMAARKREFLDQLPRDPAGQVKQLGEYEFMDAQARQEYDELKQMLQQQVMQQYFQGMQQALADMSPAEMARMREMIQALNQMLRERSEGREPDFDGFMQKYGDYFGDNINTLDDLIEEMQRRSAQMQAVMDSMSPEQRAELQEMMNQLLGDEGLQNDMAELARHITEQSKGAYRTRYRMMGDEPVSLTEAMHLMGELQGLDELEAEMRKARRQGNLDDVDSERMRQLLGEEDARSLDELKDMLRQLQAADLITKDGDNWKLTSQGIRKIGQKALQDMFQELGADAFGQHSTAFRRAGGERTDESKQYEFGDPFLLDMHATLRHSIERNGAGTPVKVAASDFEVYRTELVTQSSTVLMLDMSLSMIFSGANVAAKKMAVALESLIRGMFSRDHLYVVGFNRTAHEFKRDELVEINEADHGQGTNMIHGMMLARNLLARHKGMNKQIIMVTDGGPTMMWDKDMKEWLFTYPYTQPAELQTLLEVQRCTREGITINTFMIVHDTSLTRFVQDMSEINKGRAFFTKPEDLGKYVLIDYLKSKQVFRQG